MRSDSFLKTLSESIEFYQLFHSGDRVIIGVSGGPDSLALLYGLNELKHDYGIQLFIAHFNHKWRPESDREQAYVCQTAQTLALPYYTENWSRAVSLSTSSLEEAARMQRIRFFVRVSKKIKAHSIALAHHIDDLAETVLMRILRGTGLQGMRAILPIRKLYGVNFVRPLIRMTKEDLLAFLDDNKISYCCDKSNYEDKFFRNKIRHDLLNILKRDYNQNIVETLSNLAHNAAVDYDYLEQKANKIFVRIQDKNHKSKQKINLDKASFEKQHLSLQRMLIRLAVADLLGHTRGLTLGHLEEIDHLVRQRPLKSIVHLPHEIDVIKHKKWITFHRKS